MTAQAMASLSYAALSQQAMRIIQIEFHAVEAFTRKQQLGSSMETDRGSA